MFTTGKRLPAISVTLSKVCLSLSLKVSHSASAQSQYAFKFKMATRKPFERLSKNVLPSNYALTFKPNLEKFTFEAEADISVKVAI